MSSNYPDCYDCKWCREVPRSQFVSCKNLKSAKELKVTAEQYGVKNGWFIWPQVFDPVWLRKCEGFENV